MLFYILVVVICRDTPIYPQKHDCVISFLFIYFVTENKPDEVQSMQPPPTGTFHPSSSLRDEDERLSGLFSESGSCLKSDFCPPAVKTHVDTSDSSNTHPPEGNLKHFSKPDNTVLLNQTMEMTLSDATEIVTVESKVRKMGHPSSTKAKKNKQICGSDKANNQVKTWTQSRCHGDKADAEEPTLKDRNPEDMLQLPKSQSLNVLNSHVSKQNKKRSKNKLKCQQTEQDPEVCDVVSLNWDEDFTDPAANSSNICVSGASLPGGDGAEEVKSNITCRRSKAKGNGTSVSRQTFVSGPFLVGEPDSHFEVVEKDHAAEPDSLGKGHQFRRQTFIISDHSSPTASPAAGLTEQDTRTVRAAQDQLVTQTTSFSSQHDAHPTQRLQSRCEASSPANPDFAVPSVHPNPKKNEKNERKSFDKKEAIQKRQRTCEEEKEKEGSCLGNDKLRCSDKAQFVVDNINNTNNESEVVGGSLSGRGEEAGSSEPFYGMDMDTLKLHIPSEPRNLRKTFVIHQLDDPLDSRQSVPSDTNSHMMNTRHELENFGDVLMDERPPWLNTDAASSFSTPRRKTTDSALLNLECATEATPGG